MTASDIAAWVGAITGCLALGLEALKWARSGPRLRVAVNSNMVPLDPTPAYPREPHLFVTVVNEGDAMTTVTALAFDFYPSWWSRVRRHPESFFVWERDEHPLPRELAPGARWTHLLRRDKAIDRARDGGTLVCIVEHTMGKPTRHRVQFKRREA